ncbi:hypothetical protein Q757_02065 [Oenococcus alcoholitolerans]|uniref:NADP-dependent oxidoreductase domain-containing protein n=1 Tax=Oenococcus alcoholitolerans TaxID=931074 RepID=A0ABR4XSG4_9LACO|nr:hypothetical protein Q757_02065 [Oenococcus alcoholitolerans]
MAKKQSIPLIAYTPAARGDEFGRELFNHPLIQKIAQDHNASPIQILLAWAIRDNNTIAIPQTTKLSHMKDNLAAADIVLTKDELEAIDKQFPKPDHKVPLTMR